mmetsp:Transcript_705/g.1687  ORF Transcript_705/g.1687 Transcript_705/m.1687 type:complete len:139 (+) Transcript_705:637-1053(+)
MELPRSSHSASGTRGPGLHFRRYEAFPPGTSMVLKEGSLYRYTGTGTPQDDPEDHHESAEFHVSFGVLIDVATAVLHQCREHDRREDVNDERAHGSPGNAQHKGQVVDINGQGRHGAQQEDRQQVGFGDHVRRCNPGR